MKNSNPLAKAQSPYLQQHADNPVNWYEWNKAALDLAKLEDKPILISIGYAACHWCHVMADESFNDLETAQFMNQYFINIKIDREERPDLDHIYQTSYQLLTQQAGGWPLTVFLDPDNHYPFFIGTYFPKVARYGLPCFKDILRNVIYYYKNKKQDIFDQQQQLKTIFKQINVANTLTVAKIDDEPLVQSIADLSSEFDEHNGGFGNAPKFPQPSNLKRLLKHWLLMREQKNTDDKVLIMLETTLTKMAQGGIFDQIGGGFFAIQSISNGKSHILKKCCMIMLNC